MSLDAASPGGRGIDASDLRSTGERIEALLAASSSGGTVARERAEELVRLVVELYGAGIERMLDLLYAAGRLDEVAIDALVADELVSSLLLVHGLHPDGVRTRVERALEEVRPYLRTHGGDVELLAVTDDGTVGLRLLGSCDGCVSSAATMSLAVEAAIRDAAPEVGAIELDEPIRNAPSGDARDVNDTFIPVSSLHVRRTDVVSGDTPRWRSVPGFDDLAVGELRLAMVEDVAIVACRIGGDLFAFRDGCAACGATLGAATVERRLGGGLGDALLRCPYCGTHYDVRRAGASLEHHDQHLDPLPLLTRRGGVEVALPGAVHA